MSTTPPPPIVPVPDDDDDANLVGGAEQSLDPDLNDDLVDSAEADRRAATEGMIDGSEEQ